MSSQMSARAEDLEFPGIDRRLYGSRQIRLYSVSQALAVYVDAAVDGICEAGRIRGLDPYCVGDGRGVNLSTSGRAPGINVQNRRRRSMLNLIWSALLPSIATWTCWYVSSIYLLTFLSRPFVYEMLMNVSHAIESLLEARKAIITNAIQACHTHLEQYNRFGDGYACKANNHRDECDNQSAGSVVRPLQKFKMWPGKPEDLILNMRERSAADVEQDIKKIRSYVTPDPIQTRPGTWYMGVSHKSCPNAAPLHSVIERLANKATDIVISRYRDHLKIQKQKLADLDILELE